ncbi:MAG TPA: hypothetical protein VNM68_06640, partial [Candidatus Polarisedimenticolia bacterium]|nr:hypothetical protein [Candidatus Polarisedimenticolia bacterium]
GRDAFGLLDNEPESEAEIAAAAQALSALSAARQPEPDGDSFPRRVARRKSAASGYELVR